MRPLPLVALLLTLGCATAYHPPDITGGYEETQLNELLFQVRFRGNGFSSSSRAQSLLLRRCAELTLESGRRYFVIGSQQDSSRLAGAVVHRPLSPGFPSLVSPISRPESTTLVRILEKESESLMAIDAVAVVRQTDEAARGVLSQRAAAQLAYFEGRASVDPSKASPQRAPGSITRMGADDADLTLRFPPNMDRTKIARTLVCRAAGFAQARRAPFFHVPVVRNDAGGTITITVKLLTDAAGGSEVFPLTASVLGTFRVSSSLFDSFSIAGECVALGLIPPRTG